MNKIKLSRNLYFRRIAYFVIFIVLAVATGIIASILVKNPGISTPQLNITLGIVGFVTFLMGIVAGLLSFTMERKEKQLESLSLESLTQELQIHSLFKLDDQQSLKVLKRALSEK